MSGPGATILSILMIAAFLLALGGVVTIRRGAGGRGVLMLVAAAVFAANVLIVAL